MFGCSRKCSSAHDAVCRAGRPRMAAGRSCALAESARFPRSLRPQRSRRSARAASCSVPPRSMVAIANATPMGAKAPDAGTGTCQTGPHAPPPSVLWPASCPTGPCTAGPCCWAMSHPGSALRRPRRPPHTCGAITTEDSMLVGRWTWSVAGNGAYLPLKGFESS